MILKPALSQLRYHILMDGLQPTNNQTTTNNNNNDQNNDGLCSYRPYVWSILLNVSPQSLPYTYYLDLLNRGPCPYVDTKIRNDTFRTFKKDEYFRSRVSENSLIRILNAFAWHQILQDEQNNNNKNIINQEKNQSSTSLLDSSNNNSSSTNYDFLYVQGMNVLVAPFLYQCKSEAQAFSLFTTFLNRDCPLYIQPTLQGCHTGLKLVDLCLQIIDPTLFDHLKSKYLIAELYAFTSILTFCAGSPPLGQVLILWDFLFAYGPHLNVLLVIAQLTLIRSKLLESKNPMALLRTFPPIENATEIIKLAISFVPLLPDSLYDLLKRHPYDPTVGPILKRMGEESKR